LAFLLIVNLQEIVFGVVFCGFCRGEGNNISSCSSSGANAERERCALSNSSKVADRIVEEKSQYSISLDALDLPIPKPTLGHLKTEWADKCSSPHGVIDTNVLEQMLLHMNQNLDQKNAAAEAQSCFPSQKRRQKHMVLLK